MHVEVMVYGWETVKFAIIAMGMASVSIAMARVKYNIKHTIL